MDDMTPCSNCSGSNIYLSEDGIPGGGYGSDYLPGLGGFMTPAKLYPSICGDCGFVRFFIDEEARAKLNESSKWKKL